MSKLQNPNNFSYLCSTLFRLQNTRYHLYKANDNTMNKREFHMENIILKLDMMKDKIKRNTPKEQKLIALGMLDHDMKILGKLNPHSENDVNTFKEIVKYYMVILDKLISYYLIKDKDESYIELAKQEEKEHADEYYNY